MKQLPATASSLVIRTYFENQSVWERICEALRAPVVEGGYSFLADVTFLDDRDFQNVTCEDLLKAVPREFGHTFLFVVDRVTAQDEELPILVLDLHHQPGRTFRAIPSQIQGIENNLSIANMDFFEFADNADADGVFRGFPGS